MGDGYPSGGEALVTTTFAEEGGISGAVATLGTEVRVCAAPQCAEPPALIGVPLVMIGVWRWLSTRW